MIEVSQREIYIYIYLISSYIYIYEEGYLSNKQEFFSSAKQIDSSFV